MTSILSLDTTSKFASISVSQDKEIVLEYNFATHDELSATLIPSIEFLLNSADMKLTEIDCFGIGIGPGLFTGLRVGLATLKGLLMDTGKPVVPVVTLEALSYKPLSADKPVIPLIDARRGEVYAAVYSRPGDGLKEVQPPTLAHIDKLKDYLQPYDKYRFVGSGADVHKEFLKTNFERCKIFHRSCFLASEICKIAFHRYHNKKFITDLQQLMPLYLRRPDAEVNWEKQQRQSGK
jgi:tRNA threonylcarbamoyladenosine biosynthesis protein TsaB